jgi:RND superfamily putative drug exporter
MPIAFSLAVGVACDALLVRMTVVPAVLALAGRARAVAWCWRRQQAPH